MIADFIDQTKLPWVIVWLDWNLFNYYLSLIVFILLAMSHYWYKMPFHTIHGLLTLPVFVGFCAWVVYCAFTEGYSVG
jgi:hypothetical protein